MDALPALPILFVSPEAPPWVKSGGLGDITAALPASLRRLGHDVRVLVPAYPRVLAGRRTAAVAATFAAPGGVLPACRVLDLGEVNGAPLYALDAPALYDRPGGAYADDLNREFVDRHLRFGLLSRAAAMIGQSGLSDGFRPAILHCNDWPTGLAPGYARWIGADVRTVITLHNVSHQGNFPPDVLASLDIPAHAFAIDGVEFHGQVSFLKAGLHYADRITAVSPRYGWEIRTPEGGHGLDGMLRARAQHLRGIVNGIDVDVWNPATDPALVRRYDLASLDDKAANKRALQERLGLDVTDDLPLFGVVSRLAYQKGLDLLAAIGDDLMRLPAQLVLLGSGDRTEEAAFGALAARHPRQAGVVIGFDETLAHLIEAGADAFLMPSRFEPCGLNQLYSLRYGTPPVVRATGGLLDTVIDANDVNIAEGTANGFVFEAPSAPALLDAIHRAVTAWHDRVLWRTLQVTGMRRDSGWDASAREYIEVYRDALA